jgi:hypothetical protein
MNVSVAQGRPHTVIGVDEVMAAIRAALHDWPAAIKATWGALLLYALAAGVAARYGGSPFTAPVATIAHVVTASLAYGALYRRAFGRDLGPFGLQFGAIEARVLGSSALVGLVLLFAGVLAFILIGCVVLGVVMATNPVGFNAGSEVDWRAALAGPVGIAVTPVPLLCLAGLVWLGLRLILAPAASVAEHRLRALAAFPYTRGAAFGLFILALALGAPMLLASGAAAAIGRLPGAPHWAASAALGAAFAFYAAPLWTGALTHVYQRQRPAPAAAEAR